MLLKLRLNKEKCLQNCWLLYFEIFLFVFMQCLQAAAKNDSKAKSTIFFKTVHLLHFLLEFLLKKKKQNDEPFFAHTQNAPDSRKKSQTREKKMRALISNKIVSTFTLLSAAAGQFAHHSHSRRLVFCTFFACLSVKNRSMNWLRESSVCV